MTHHTDNNLPAAEPLIRVADLTFAYPDGSLALRSITTGIYPHEFIALIGQNGSGKTTLSKCLNGLLVPTDGSIQIDDIDTRRRGVVKQIVTRVGYVFQNPDHQLFNNTVFGEIAYGPRNLALPEDEVRARVEEAAQVAGVRADLFETHPFFLPKGLRQRIAIASILALKPRTIIVDEPTTGQDLRQSLDIMNFLEHLWAEQGHTIIIVTHEMSIVARYARRVIAMADGQIVLDGPPRTVFAQPETLRRCGVRPPQATQLAQALGSAVLPPDLLNADEVYTALHEQIAAEQATSEQ